MNDVQCPYCETKQDINHDDGRGYEEDEIHEQECKSCDKTFVFSTSVSFSYLVSKADCLNGAKHDMGAFITYPQFHPDQKRCADCGYEDLGKIDNKARDDYFSYLYLGGKDKK